MYIRSVVAQLLDIRRQYGLVYAAPLAEILSKIEDGKWPKWEHEESALIDRIEAVLDGKVQHYHPNLTAWIARNARIGMKRAQRQYG